MPSEIRFLVHLEIFLKIFFKFFPDFFKLANCLLDLYWLGLGLEKGVGSVYPKYSDCSTNSK